MQCNASMILGIANSQVKSILFFCILKKEKKMNLLYGVVAHDDEEMTSETVTRQ